MLYCKVVSFVFKTIINVCNFCVIHQLYNIVGNLLAYFNKKLKYSHYFSEGVYPNQQSNQNERRHSFNNNNKVLVGGNNGKTNHKDLNTNLIQINSRDFEKKEPHSAPVLPPLSNPFENMPPALKKFNMPFQKFPAFHRDFEEKEENSNDSACDEELRSRGIENPAMRQVSPEFEFNNSEWQQRPFNNQRFPRNWGPRTNGGGFRPQFGPGPPHMWPRNGPRPPNRWMGPRPQRFW